MNENIFDYIESNFGRTLSPIEYEEVSNWEDNELIEILKEFDEKRVEQLNDNARNLFYAIMDIANDRDRLLEEKQELIDYLKEQIKLCKKAQQLALKSKNIEQVGFLNLRIAIYQEILSKIEKE